MSDISKNANIAKVKCALDIGFFYKWLSFLTPFHKLTKSERQVLASFLSKRFELMKVIKDDDILDNVLNSVDVRRDVRQAIGLTNAQFNILLSKLKRNKVIIGNKIDKHYIPNIKPDTNHYRLTIIFDINEEYSDANDIRKKRPDEDGEDSIGEATDTASDSIAGL